MNWWQWLVLLATGLGFLWLGYRLGLQQGRADAIQHYKESLGKSERKALEFRRILAMDEHRPRLRSAVIKPTASRRSQVEMDDDSR